MPDDRKPNTKKRYANLMEEAKQRIVIIDHALNGRTGLPSPFVREFCWLQLRMLCEVIAVGCLVAHGDIALFQPRKVTKETSAEDILKRLSNLRPHFFPVAYIPTKKSKPVPHTHIEPMKPEPLTKDDLLTLYGKTHRHLHRGSLKTIMALDEERPSLDTKIDAPMIAKWLDRLKRLLDVHHISISDEEQIICVLGRVNAHVQVATLEPHSMPGVQF
ncbi:MAG: hypothetical protein AB7P20_19205 [Rhizobiaceae bacterium]